MCVFVCCLFPAHLLLRLALRRMQDFVEAVLSPAPDLQPVLPDPLHSSLCCAPPESGHKVSKLKSRPLQHKTTRQPYQRILKSSRPLVLLVITLLQLCGCRLLSGAQAKTALKF